MILLRYFESLGKWNTLNIPSQKSLSVSYTLRCLVGPLQDHNNKGAQQIWLNEQIREEGVTVK